MGAGCTHRPQIQGMGDFGDPTPSCGRSPQYKGAVTRQCRLAAVLHGSKPPALQPDSRAASSSEHPVPRCALLATLCSRSPAATNVIHAGTERTETHSPSVWEPGCNPFQLQTRNQSSPYTLLMLLGLFKLNLLSMSIISFYCSVQCCSKRARLIKLHSRLCTDTFDGVTGVIHGESCVQPDQG